MNRLGFFFCCLAWWMNRHQQDVIDYLQEEDRVLKEVQGGLRLRFTNAQRCLLAAKANGQLAAVRMRRMEYLTVREFASKGACEERGLERGHLPLRAVSGASIRSASAKQDPVTAFRL